MDVKTNQEVGEEIRTTKGSGHRLWVVSYVILSVICLGVYFLLQFQVFGLLGTYRSLLQRLTLAGLVVSFVFIRTKRIEGLGTKGSNAKKVSYNFIGLIRLLVF